MPSLLNKYMVHAVHIIILELTRREALKIDLRFIQNPKNDHYSSFTNCPNNRQSKQKINVYTVKRI